MKAIASLRALSVVVLLSLLPVFAADPSKPAKAEAKPKESAAQAGDPWQRRVPELALDGLPLSEVANYLSESGGFPEINFVMADDVKDIPIKLKLRSVTLDDIFTAIALTTHNTIAATKVSDTMVSFQQKAVAAEEAVDDKPVCRAFSLSRYLAGKSDKDVDMAMADVEQALDLCWKMLQKANRTDGRTEAPLLNLHRGTKLLIVVGQPSQVGVVEQVIQQLEEGASVSAAAIDPATGLPLPAGYGAPGAAPGIPSTPKPPGAR